MVEKLLLLVISVVLIICTRGLTKAINNQAEYMESARITDSKISTIYNLLSGVEDVCFSTND